MSIPINPVHFLKRVSLIILMSTLCLGPVKANTLNDCDIEKLSFYDLRICESNKTQEFSVQLDKALEQARQDAKLYFKQTNTTANSELALTYGEFIDELIASQKAWEAMVAHDCELVFMLSNGASGTGGEYAASRCTNGHYLARIHWLKQLTFSAPDA